MTTWVLLMTIWLGEGFEQRSVPYASDELCQKAGMAWILEQKRVLGPWARVAAYCIPQVTEKP